MPRLKSPAICLGMDELTVEEGGDLGFGCRVKSSGFFFQRIHITLSRRRHESTRFRSVTRAKRIRYSKNGHVLFDHTGLAVWSNTLTHWRKTNRKAHYPHDLVVPVPQAHHRQTHLTSSTSRKNTTQLSSVFSCPLAFLAVNLNNKRLFVYAQEIIGDRITQYSREACLE
jgi:hypothetical protein